MSLSRAAATEQTEHIRSDDVWWTWRMLSQSQPEGPHWSRPHGQPPLEAGTVSAAKSEPQGAALPTSQLVTSSPREVASKSVVVVHHRRRCRCRFRRFGSIRRCGLPQERHHVVVCHKSRRFFVFFVFSFSLPEIRLPPLSLGGAVNCRLAGCVREF